MTEDAETATLVVPAWLGPNKVFVLSQGRAFKFGVFALVADRLSFATAGEVVFELRRQELTVKWPRRTLGVGCQLITASRSWLLFFSKPFPDAPSPDPDNFGTAFSLMQLAEYLPLKGLPANAILGGNILGSVVDLIESIKENKAGRRVAEVVRPHLGEG